MTKSQRNCLQIISLAGGKLSHDDNRLDWFCVQSDGPVDVFNQCHNHGWLISRHDDRTDSSAVYLTEAGSRLLGTA